MLVILVKRWKRSIEKENKIVLLDSWINFKHEFEGDMTEQTDMYIVILLSDKM